MYFRENKDHVHGIRIVNVSLVWKGRLSARVKGESWAAWEEPGEKGTSGMERVPASVFNNPPAWSDTRKMLRISLLCLLTIGFPAGDAVSWPCVLYKCHKICFLFCSMHSKNWHPTETMEIMEMTTLRCWESFSLNTGRVRRRKMISVWWSRMHDWLSQ